MENRTQRNREQRLRRQARSKGFILIKSKTRLASLNNPGLYRIVDTLTNTIAAGEMYDLTLNDAEEYLKG